MFDYIFNNASLIDGTGAAAFKADIGVKDGKIAAVGQSLPSGMDLNGRTVAPGFIDIHRHADAAVLRPGFGELELRQGLTTIINGNCGMSIVPGNEEISTYISPVVGELPKKIGNFTDYRALLERSKLPMNVGTLAGSGTLRAAISGYHVKELDANALKALHNSLEEAIAAGIRGVSVGFSYLPDLYYKPQTLAKALAPLRGGKLPIVCHVRGEGGMLYESIEEAITAAKLLSVPLHISHFKCIGRRNWGKLLHKTIGLIEKSQAEGQAITCDVYPWTAGSTQLANLLPPEFLEGGFADTTKRLQDPKQRALCRDIMSRPSKEFENVVESMGWQSVYISGLKSPGNSDCIGKSISEIAAMRACDPFDAAFDILAEENCDVTMINYITCEEDIAAVLALDYSCVISDSLYGGASLPHPRCYGNVAMLLSEYVNKRGALTLEQAINKLSGLPAQILGIENKGLIKPGYDADLLVIKPEGLSSTANYQRPNSLASGIDLVLVNGQVALENDALTGVKNGRVI